jgi:hypothetical protein
MEMERPILFSTEMVKLIIEGRKTQTRRVITAPRDASGFFITSYKDGSNRKPVAYDEDERMYENYINCPYGKPGDVLWVRETWADIRGTDLSFRFIYRADIRPGSESDEIRKQYGVKWRPSIHMPREAARLFLKVTDVRVERLQAITEDDCWKEGISEEKTGQLPYINKYGVNCAVAMFSNLWDSLNKRRGCSWQDNPWIWAISFQRGHDPTFKSWGLPVQNR